MKDLIAQTTKGYLDGFRYIIHEGGTRSGKTHSILNVLYHITNSRNKETISSVISESMPHLRRGSMRDYKRILQSQKVWNDNDWNKTDSIHNLSKNKIIEFFSADNADKVHGPERDYLFINEAQNISYETARHLFVRTRKTIFVDFNPTREFWCHTELKNDPRTLWIHSTYKDNPFLTINQVEEIERNKLNKSWWKIYGEGIIAESDAAVYSGWKIIDEIPHEARLERYGLDFGYSVDPTAVVAIYRHNGGFILDEILYRKGMLNKQIADFMLNQPNALIVADSAEPKSISELNTYGLQVIKSKKGVDSIKFGISTVQQQRISITKRSTNGIKEYRGYLWETDRDGKFLQTPESGNDHFLDACFVGDTPIITMGEITPIKNICEGLFVLTSSGYKRVLKKWDNGIKQVYKYSLQFDTFNIELECTPDHKIKTGSTWTPISKLKSGQMVTLTKDLMEKYTNSIQEKNTFQNILLGCIPQFGSFIMGRFQKAIKFTTGIKTHGIILSKTSRSLLDQNTRIITQNVELKKIGNGLLLFKKKELQKLQNGIDQRMVGSGTQNTEKEVGIIGNIKLLFAKFVGKNIKQDMQGFRNIAITTAKLKRLDVGESSKKRVYDLTVEDNHEYFANGVLVHNCRYGIKNLIPDDIIPKTKFSGQNILDQLLNEEYL